MSSVHEIVLKFLVTGMPDVSRAFQTIEQRAASLGHSAPVPVRPRNAPSAQTDRDAARASAAALAEEYRRAENRGSSMRRPAMRIPIARTWLGEGPPEPTHAQRAADFVGPPAPTAQQRRAADHDADREAKAKVRAMIKADAEIARIRERAAAQADRQAKDAERRAEQTAKAESRAVERAARETAKIRERENNEILRDAARLNRLESREAQKKATEQKRDRESFARGLGTVGSAIAGGAAAGVGRVAGIAGHLAGAAMQIGGGFDLADAVAEQGKLERSAVEFSNSAFMGKEGETRMDPKAIQAQARATALATGMDASEIVKGASSYGAKTGNYQEGLDASRFFAKVSKGTGATMADVAKTAGILRVQNKDLGKNEMEDLILQTVRQGQQGSVEFSDLAKVAGKVTRTSASYAGNQAENQGKLLGLAQIAMRTSGSPDEAATVISNLSADAMKHSDAVVEKLGKGAFNDKGQIAKAPEEFIADVMQKTGGNLMKIQDLGFGARSMKMFQALAPTFNKAEDEKKGSGRDAVLGDIREVTAGSMSRKQLDENVTAILSTSTEQFEAAMRDLKMAIGTGLLPEFTKLIGPMKQLTPAIVQLVTQGTPAFVELITTVTKFAEAHRGIVDSIAAHPVGALIGLEISKSFADAALPQLLQKLLTSAVTAMGGGGGGAGGGAGTAAAGIGGAAAGLVGAGLALQGAAAYDIYGSVTGAQERGKTRGDELASRLNAGDPRAQAEIDRIQKMASPERKVAAVSDYAEEGINALLGGPLAAAGGWLGNKAAAALGYGDKTERARSEQTIEAQATVDASIVKKSEISDATTTALLDGIRAAQRQAALEVQPARPSEGFDDRRAKGNTGIVQRTQ